MARKAATVKWIKDYKSKHPCETCGELDWRCLDFHHKKKKEEKKREIGIMVRNGNSIANILKEIEKCQVLCANCHRKLHTPTTKHY